MPSQNAYAPSDLFAVKLFIYATEEIIIDLVPYTFYCYGLRYFRILIILLPHLSHVYTSNNLNLIFKLNLGNYCFLSWICSTVQAQSTVALILLISCEIGIILYVWFLLDLFGWCACAFIILFFMRRPFLFRFHWFNFFPLGTDYRLTK